MLTLAWFSSPVIPVTTGCSSHSGRLFTTRVPLSSEKVDAQYRSTEYFFAISTARE